MKTIKEKIQIPMIILSIISAAAVLLANIFLFNNDMDKEMTVKVNTASAVTENQFNSLKTSSYASAMAIAKDPQIIKAISERNRDIILNIATKIQKDTGVEFCTITDAEGTVLARTDEPDNYGDSIASQANVISALSGKNLTSVEEGTSVRLSVRSGVSVYDDNGIIIGVISAGFRMDTDVFVDKIKNLMGCEATVFLEDERISTTVLNSDGKRAIGTKASETVSSQVLSGKTYEGQTQVLGRDAFVKYIPIQNGIDGSIIGMLFVGRYMSEKVATMWKFVTSGLIILLIIIVAGAIISLFVSKGIENQIKNIIINIKNSTSKIASATRGLTEISSNLANGSSDQAAAIEETSATMNESASMIAQNAENTRQATLLAQTAKNSADTGNEKIQDLVQSMERLKESSGTISKIIKTIDDIAFQTNLLAINATVEAARAGGDAGRSFSVVAEEVRSLAKKSSDAAANTTEIIEKNITMTNSGTKISSDVSDALQNITDEFDRLNKIISEINIASEEQSHGIKQINTAVSQMEKVTQQTAAVAEEASASSQNLYDEVDTLHQIVAEASKLIKNFNIDL